MSYFSDAWLLSELRLKVRLQKLALLATPDILCKWTPSLNKPQNADVSYEPYGWSPPVPVCPVPISYQYAAVEAAAGTHKQYTEPQHWTPPYVQW